jgi:hypothetical protein
MVHDLPGSVFMSVRRKFPGPTLGFAVLGIVMLIVTAGADPSADSRLIFDPGALDRSQLGADRNAPQRSAAKPADVTPTQASEQHWIPNTFELPDFSDRSRVSRGLAQGLSSPKNQLAPADTNLFEQRVTPGTLSIGLETETIIKQRSLSGDGEKDPERDTILDPKRQRGFLPFIGLSAKSPLQ